MTDGATEGAGERRPEGLGAAQRQAHRHPVALLADLQVVAPARAVVEVARAIRETPLGPGQHRLRLGVHLGVALGRGRRQGVEGVHAVRVGAGVETQEGEVGRGSRHGANLYHPVAHLPSICRQPGPISDHPDQVRVQYDGKADGYIESITTFRYAGNAISEEHSFEKIGLTCKIFEDRYDGKLGSFNPTHCYHASEDLEKRVAAFSIYNGLREMRVSFCRTRQGRTESVEIDMSKANIAQWKLIETKVWDLIDRWNVIS